MSTITHANKEKGNTEENDNKTALKSGIWYTFSNFLLKGISFITIPLFTRLLTHEEFGQFNNYSAWLQIMIIIATLNVPASLISAKYDFKKDFDKYILSMFSLSTLSIIIWSIVINVFRDFFENFTSLDIYYINCMLVYLFFYSAFALFQTRERFKFKYKANVIISIINAVATALLSVMLVLFLQNRFEGRVLGSIIPTIIISGCIIIYLVKKAKGIDIKYWKYALKVCLPYIPHSLSLILLGSVDRIMITKICGNEYNALYSLAYSCSMVIMILVTSLNEAYAPWLGDRLEEKKYEDIKKISNKYILIFIYIALGMMLLIPEALFIMGGSSYLEAKFVLAPVALGCIYQFLYTMFVNIEQFKKKTVSMAIASILAAILNYVLNLIFIPKYGYIAAAYTTAIGYFSLLAMHMYIVKKIGYKEVYNYKFIILISIIAFVFTILVNAVYLDDIIRYIFIAIYIVVTTILILKFKDIIKKTVKNIKNK